MIKLNVIILNVLKSFFFIGQNKVKKRESSTITKLVSKEEQKLLKQLL